MKNNKFYSIIRKDQHGKRFLSSYHYIELAMSGLAGIFVDVVEKSPGKYAPKVVWYDYKDKLTTLQKHEFDDKVDTCEWFIKEYII